MNNKNKRHFLAKVLSLFICTTVAVSMAVAKAAAASSNIPLYRYLGGNWVNELPYPLGNMMNGGAHAGINAPDIQEFLVVPIGAKNIVEAKNVIKKDIALICVKIFDSILASL